MTNAVIVSVLAVLFITSGLIVSDGITAIWAGLLFLVIVGPGAYWVVKGKSHLPLFEIFAGEHLLYYWLPAGGHDGEFLSSPPELRAMLLMIVCLFLFSGAVVYFIMLSRIHRYGRWLNPFLSYQVVAPNGRAGWMMGAMYLTVAYYVLFQGGWLNLIVPASVFPVVRATFMSLGSLAIFFLGLQLGRKRLRFVDQLSFVSLLGVCVLINALSGFLIHAAALMAIVFLAYALGAKRIPLIGMGVCLVLFSFLNLGKSEWREKHWYGGGATASPLAKISDWFQASWRGLEVQLSDTSEEPQQKKKKRTILERLDLTEIACTVIRRTPEQLPFMEGETYLESLDLLVPRFIWPERRSNHEIMTRFAKRYGLFPDDSETSKMTNISVGPITEAWANGGWIAVALVGAFMGFFCGVGTSLAYGREPEEVGILLAVPFAILVSTGAMDFMLGATVMAFNHYFFTTLIIVYIVALLKGRVRPTHTMG